MKKVVILGCENSHANKFLDFVKEGVYPEAEVAGVYSDTIEAAEKLKETYGVPVLQTPEEAVPYADGVIVTARHGGRHYPLIAPYIRNGLAIFMDKPITIREDDVVKMLADFRDSGVRFTGGSCCRYHESIQKLKQDHLKEEGGKTVGGYVRAPITLVNEHGGFFFYAQHLVEMVTEIFGLFPHAVQAFQAEDQITVVFRYEKIDVTGLFVSNSWKCYSAARFSLNATDAMEVHMGPECFRAEFDEFYRLLLGGEQRAAYESLAQPVFIMNAIVRSLESGRAEPVRVYEA